jgi:hypothetical protein
LLQFKTQFSSLHICDLRKRKVRLNSVTIWSYFCCLTDLCQMCYDALKVYTCLKWHQKVIISKILWWEITLGSLGFNLRVICESFLECVNIEKKLMLIIPWIHGMHGADISQLLEVLLYKRYERNTLTLAWGATW